MKRLLLGYLFGIALGLPLGLLSGGGSRCSTTRWACSRSGLQTLPSVCWVPLALLWFGQTESAMFFVVVMGTLWSVIIATDNGVRHTCRRSTPGLRAPWVRANCTHGCTSCCRLRCPFVVSGMKQGWAFAWRSLMAAEIYVTILSGFGLGHLLHYGRELNAMDQVIAIMFVIIAIGLLADQSPVLPMGTVPCTAAGAPRETNCSS